MKSWSYLPLIFFLFQFVSISAPCIFTCVLFLLIVYVVLHPFVLNHSKVNLFQSHFSIFLVKLCLPCCLSFVYPCVSVVLYISVTIYRFPQICINYPSLCLFVIFWLPLCIILWLCPLLFNDIGQRYMEVTSVMRVGLSFTATPPYFVIPLDSESLTPFISTLLLLQLSNLQSVRI